MVIVFSELDRRAICAALQHRGLSYYIPARLRRILSTVIGN